jgi:AcrR family transcriptional regulator
MGKMPPRQRLPAPDRRRQILDVSRRLFAEKGYYATTTRDIARTAGVSDALLYTYFSSKQEVLDAIIEEGMEEWAVHQQVSTQALPVREYLMQTGRAFLQNLLHQRELLVILSSTSQLHGAKDTRWAHFIERLAQGGAQQLAARAAAGELRQGPDYYLVSRHFASALVAYVLLQEVLGLERIAPLDPMAYLTQLVETMLYGLLPPAER